MGGFYLRSAEYSDMDLLFKWANDPIVRNYSFNTETIPYDDHVKWFTNMLEDKSVLQFVMMDDDTPVGQIRLNIDGDEAEIGYSIAREYRGKGYGRKILQLIADRVSKGHPEIKKLVAKVKPENVVSSTLFEKENYDKSYLCYIREL